MISNTLIAGSGLSLEKGEVIGLSEASELRARAAADIYHGLYSLPDNSLVPPELSDDVHFYFAGAYPRLPKGITSIDPSLREGTLMRMRAIEDQLPQEITSAEVSSTSTVKNALFTLRHITGVQSPDKRDIARFVNPDRQLGIVAGPGQMPRLRKILGKIGCEPAALYSLPTTESVRLYDRVSGAAYVAGSLLVPQGNVRMLLAVDRTLEWTNDAIHAAHDMAQAIKPSTHGQTKVVS